MRVLYVEDNRINALLFAEIVQPQDSIELRIAEDGAQALQLASVWPPDLLVIDAHLPDMNGYELLGKLRALPGQSQAPAYMCSADTAAQDFARAANAGFDGYWMKPVNVASVRSELADMARSHEGRNSNAR